MAYFYALLASPDGRSPVPRFVESDDPARVLDLPATALAGLRAALVSVVEGGTATASRIADLHIAGKTGTAQNAHGDDHGWFVAFAPAEAPQVVVAAIVEFARHGSTVAPMVTRIIQRHLQGSTVDWLDARLVVPEDSAPEAVPILPQDSAVGRTGPRTR
jgi:penicillin-binding protein 2